MTTLVFSRDSFSNIMTNLAVEVLDNIFATLAGKYSRHVSVIKQTMDLFAQGNTIPFIARYRKDVTKELDEVQLRDLQRDHGSLVNLEERRNTILGSIQDQGKLTPELEAKIKEASTLTELEDLYLPYKPKKQTKAQKAREAGLEPLADMIAKEQPIEGDKLAILQQFFNPDKGIMNEKDALDGAMEIIAETISEEAETRKALREIVDVDGELQSKAVEVPTDTEIDEAGSDSSVGVGKPNDEEVVPIKTSKDKYTDYFDFKLKFRALKPHQVLAINRGENEGFLDVELVTNDAEFVEALKADHVKNQTSIFKDDLEKSIDRGYSRMARTIKRESWVQKIEEAKSHGVKVFSENVRKLLLQQPIKGRRILGVDPGFRNGCKCAVIDENGKYLDKATVYPHPPQQRADEAKNVLLDLVKKHKAYTIAIGNGTASRETEVLVADMAQVEPNIEYTIVSEAGASVYSASDIAREEFPDLDVSIRGAVSIARRLQDPLSELIKIDPKAIGVGLYQHDVNQTELGDQLKGVVEDCVNTVGVNVNNASTELLKYVSGLNSRVAKEIVTKRESDGAFSNREQLKDVKFLGEKTYEQAAGFLKVLEGDNPLDSTFIHPESYEVAIKILEDMDATPSDLLDAIKLASINARLSDPGIISKFQNLAGEATLKDIIDALKKPRRDPRDDLPPVLLKKDVLKPEDLQVGMVLKGTVRNVVDFGAFVDIGLHYNGLVHVSEIANKFVKNPHEHLSVGDVVDVMVKEVDLPRKRIQLSIKALQERELAKSSEGGMGPKRPPRPRNKPESFKDMKHPGIMFKEKQQKKKAE
ncbi:MAG TPA: Tex family protein [Candidatus Lokiarchaeia archaeon]|nr:Tex family protein [Candidatus Lokiarchaeia archaeon]